MAGAGLLAIAALLSYALNVAGVRDRLEGGSPQRTESIAVLPLENLMNDPEQDYFVDGMHDALITDLSKIGALKVISRGSVLRFKERQQSIPEIARELGVDGVVEGSVLRAEDRVRITAQLIDGATDGQLWAESYTRDLRDILALQSEVARAIAREIRVAVTPEEDARLASRPPVDPEAYQLYLKGNYLLGRFSEEAFAMAVEHYQRAIEKSPSYAPAYASLSLAYQRLGGWHTSQAFEDFQARAEQAAVRGLELDDGLAEAHVALARIRFFAWDWAGADDAFARGFELDPTLTVARVGYANFLTAMARFEESIAIGRRTLEIDPLSPVAYIELAWALMNANRDEEAIDVLKQGLELEPDYAQLHWALETASLKTGRVQQAMAHLEKAESLYPATRAPNFFGWVGHDYALAGRRDEALRVLETLSRQSEELPGTPTALAHVYLGLGRHREALDHLERAWAERSIVLVWLKVHHAYDPLRSHPRFQALLRRMDFPD